ncbi:FMN-dependent NADH-azoreductase [Pseudomonas sp. v388]|uniref:FMN-dependent NADH-azoreductase n=1 Tax=Pseudomonas sp. v388 TaxID=2479849 RepID=UPI000F790C62|nr:NAD(P)H-dependent oxidoreductase [Pseudomonas sp. v388]RRV10700.1 FMN-dependent NADH-azoreductase [Pseudomonas sp. v388]
MHELLLLNASPRDTSVGLRLAREMVSHLSRHHPQARVSQRDLIAAPLLPLTADYATALTRPTPAHDAVFSQSEQLVRELENSAALVIATPMHNFTVPAALKLWIDNVVRIGRTFDARPTGKVGLLATRPVYVVVSSGGFHRGPNARQPDFLTDYLSHVLQTIGLGDTHFVYLQGLVQGQDAVAAAYTQARRELGRHAPFAEWSRT